MAKIKNHFATEIQDGEKDLDAETLDQIIESLES